MSELNKSGWLPYDSAVIIRLIEPQEKKSKGGVLLTSSIDAVSLDAVQKGYLVAMGTRAFEEIEDAPKLGDEVFFIKYSGEFIPKYMSNDDCPYRIMESHDIRGKKND